MGYGIAPVVNVLIDNENLASLFEEDPMLEKSFDIMLDALRSQKLTIPDIERNPIFFKTLKFYNRLTSVVLDFSNTKSPLLDEEETVPSPPDILEILIAVWALSSKMPDTVVKLGIGDIAVFWADFTFQEGELISIDLTRETYDGAIQKVKNPGLFSSQDAFVCSKEEMMEFFDRMDKVEKKSWKNN
jgi:hypothetical protein